MKPTRKQYLRLYLDDAYISQHTSVLEAAESASKNGPGTYEVRVGSEVFYEVTIFRAITDDTDLIVPTPNPPKNNPPVWDSQPAPVFVIGVASNYDFDDISSDPDLDSTTVALNTGAVSLPGDVTYNAAEKRLEYGGGGVVETTMGHVATLSDGTDNVDSVLFNVQISETVAMNNYPINYAAMGIVSVNTHMDNHPTKGIYEKSDLFVHQGLNMANSGARANTYARFLTMRTANPYVNISVHIDILTITFDQNTNAADRWLEDQAWANPADYDEYFLRESPGGDFVSHLAGQGRGFALNWNCSNTVMDRIVGEQIDQFSDYDGVSNMMADFTISVMHDTQPETDFSRYREPVHSGTISGITSSTEIDIPTWSNPDTSGGPDGQGYISLSRETTFVAVQQNRQDGSQKNITGVNAAGNRVRLASALEMNDQSGDDFEIFETSGSRGGSSATGEMSESQRLAGILNFHARYEATALADHGVNTLRIRNGGAVSHTKKVAGEAPAFPSSWIGEWDYEQHERFCAGVAGFFQYNNQDYRTAVVPGATGGITQPDHAGTNYNATMMMRALEYNKLFLRPNAECPTGNPCVLLNAQCRYFTNYDSLSEIDASFLRFYAVLAACMNNVMPLFEMDRRHEWAVLIAEMVLQAGTPITARDFGTYDEATNGGTGSFSWDAPDFGTFGFWKRFGSLLGVINFRAPTNPGIWIPNHLPGGQSIDPALDVCTLPAPTPGFKWQFIDNDIYINNDPSSRFYQMGPSDFDLNEKIIRDDILNNGADCGLTVNCGAVEAMFLLEVPA